MIGVCHDCGEIHETPYDLCDNCWEKARTDIVARHIEEAIARLVAE